MRHLTPLPLDVAALIASVQSAERGATACFVGTVRNHHAGRAVRRLEYSAYEAMADAECTRVVEEAERKWPVRVALQHRVGALALGDAAVAVAVTGAHRDEAFAACRYTIEEVKRRVPIWKREYYEDGSVAWVDPTAPGGAVPSAASGGTGA